MNLEAFAARIIGRRYWFATSIDQQLHELTPVCLVAVRDTHDMWAAYIAGVGTDRPEDDDMAHHVAIFGAKLDETTARAMFPDVDLPYRK